jgi:putrescine---pyruvate transaminase
MSRLWHGFASMGAVDNNEFVLVRGQGSQLWDREGNEYLDASGGVWFCSVGHGRGEIADVASQQLRTLAAHHCFGDHANQPAIDLADLIVERSRLADGAVFFGSGGSEAVDTAGKLVRRYWGLVGQPKKTIIISRQYGYHGMAAYGTALSGIPALTDGYGTMIPETLRVRWDEPEDLEETLDRYDGRVAAFIGEPVIGAGGAFPPPDGYWPEIQRICRERDILFIQDEVVTGFGRIGEWFGAHRYGVEPDLIIFAKGVTSGYLPLGGVLVGPRVKELFWQPQAPPFRHGFTYSGHAAACAVGLANLAIIDRERLVERVVALEPIFARLCDTHLRSLPLVADVRTIGLMGAVEFTAEALEQTPGLADRAALACRNQGVITRGLRGAGLQLSPPFVTTENELERMITGIAAGIIDTANHLAPDG